jgi:hypothetical protein
MATLQELSILIKLIDETIKNPENEDELSCGQFKDVYNFLRESYDCLNTYVKGDMSFRDVIEFLDLCPNLNPVFTRNCDCGDCEDIIRERKRH